MRFPNDTAFHLRMAALVVGSLFLEHLAVRHLPAWTSPQIGVITFVLGLAWVLLAAFQHARTTQERLRVLETRLDRTNELAETLAAELRARRSLPPM